MADTQEKIIELLEKSECLWRVEIPEYRDRDKKRKVTEEIAKSVGLSAEEVRKKINNLRTYYGKEIQKISASKESGAGSGDVFRSKWAYFELLGFLQPYTFVKKTVSNLEDLATADIIADDSQETRTEDVSDDEEDEESESILKRCDVIFPTPSTSSTRCVENETLKRKLSGIVPPKNKRVKPEDELLKISVKSLKECKDGRRNTVEEEETGDQVFGKLVTSQLATITDLKTKEFVKMRIHQVIFEGQYGTYMPNLMGPSSMPPMPSHLSQN